MDIHDAIKALSSVPVMLVELRKQGEKSFVSAMLCPCCERVVLSSKQHCESDTSNGLFCAQNAPDINSVTWEDAYTGDSPEAAFIAAARSIVSDKSYMQNGGANENDE